LEGRFLWALSLTILVLLAEVAGGLWTHSLALLSDAAHVPWSLCPGSVALSAHVTVDGDQWNEVSHIQAALKDLLRDRFRIEHTTIQLECTQCPQGAVACVNGA
jgi:Co/Zn/Cd efflux system component